MIILDEVKYAKDHIESKMLDEKPFTTLSIIGKYYYHCMGYRKKRIVSELTTFMLENYPPYSNNRIDWDDAIDSIASSAGKYKLFVIDGVWITENEIRKIENIHNKVLERLAFTLLCIAKLNNIKNPKNNGWVNTSAKEIFSIARISCSVSDRFERLSRLAIMSLVDVTQKNENLNVRVTFIDDDSEKQLHVTDFRELGYEYLRYKGGNFINCGKCGILIRNNKNKTKKYCVDCAGYTPIKHKEVRCIDCGITFEVSSKNVKTNRCSYCKREFIRSYDRERKKRISSA